MKIVDKAKSRRPENLAVGTVYLSALGNLCMRLRTNECIILRSKKLNQVGSTSFPAADGFDVAKVYDNAELVLEP